MLKIIVLIIVLFAISRVILRFKDRQLSFREMLFWVVIWTATIFLLFDPNISNILANYLGIGRGVDAVFFLAIILVFYLVFRLYVKLDKLDRNITELNSNTSKAMQDIKNSLRKE